MTRLRLLLLAVVVVVLIAAGLGAGAWWYLFGNNEIDSADLVPANSLFFASIPNAAALLEGYQSSQARTLIGSPNLKPVHDYLAGIIDQKNVDLLQAFLPNLSGQSFIAVTHFDYDHPEKVGLIAAMKPKAGLGDFGSFLDKLKATYPVLLKQGTTGTATVEGVAYDWIQGPGATDKICVAHLGGWIVTTWGEASLQDWIERYRRKSDTSSLAKDMNYEKCLVRVGDNPMTMLYVNYHCLVDIVQKQMAKTNPAAATYLGNKLEALGAMAIATRFEDGEIVDRFSVLYPRPAQIDSGLGEEPCTFDTLKFTGPDTRFYWAASVNWKQYARKIHEQSRETESVNPIANNTANFLENWVHTSGLDPQQNIIEPLGPEVSVQAEWPEDATWPELGVLVKVDKPDDFKPTIAAIINTVRQAYGNSGTIQQTSAGGQNLATLQFPQPSILSPTITEDGPYLGLFLSKDQAMQTFQRKDAGSLARNADFMRQIGDKRGGASQILFVDSPYLVNRAYTTAMPYLSIAAMFNKNVADLIGGGNLPPDLKWLAPMGTWSCVVTTDEEGVQAYSASGIGNQGIVFAGAADAASSVLQNMGILPRQTRPLDMPFGLGAPTLPLALNPNQPPHVVLPAPPRLAVLNYPPPPNGQVKMAGSIISITADGSIYFDNALVSKDKIDDFLKAKKAGNQDLKLFVHVDKNAPPDDLTLVTNAGAAAGFGVLDYTYTSGTDSSPVGAIIYITIDNKIFFDAEQVSMDQIGDFLKAKKAANEDLKLTVHVDQDSSPDVLSRVMDAGASAGFGVLPYTYTKGADSQPPSTNAASSLAPLSPLPATGTPATSTPVTNLSTHVPPLPIPTADGASAISAPTQPQ